MQLGNIKASANWIKSNTYAKFPASLEGAYLQRTSLTPNQSEGMSDRSPSPLPSEPELKDDEENVTESLLTMTDLNDPPSQRATPPDIRILMTTSKLIGVRGNSTNEY